MTLVREVSEADGNTESEVGCGVREWWSEAETCMAESLKEMV